MATIFSIDNIGIDGPGVIVRHFRNGRLLGIACKHQRVWVHPDRIASVMPIKAEYTLMDVDGSLVEYAGGGGFETPVSAEAIARAWLGDPVGDGCGSVEGAVDSPAVRTNDGVDRPA